MTVLMCARTRRPGAARLSRAAAARCSRAICGAREARPETLEIDVTARIAQLRERRALGHGRALQLDDDLGARGGRESEPGHRGGRQQRTERDQEGTRWQRHRSSVPRKSRFASIRYKTCRLKRMSGRHARMIEIVGRIVRHADPAHDRPRAHVRGRRERDQLLGAQCAERVGCARERGLGRVALPPVLGREPPADLDAGREMRLERRHDEPDEADERRDARHLDRPRAEAVAREVPLGAPRERVALPSREQSPGSAPSRAGPRSARRTARGPRGATPGGAGAACAGPACSRLRDAQEQLAAA